MRVHFSASRLACMFPTMGGESAFLSDSDILSVQPGLDPQRSQWWLSPSLRPALTIAFLSAQCSGYSCCWRWSLYFGGELSRSCRNILMTECRSLQTAKLRGLEVTFLE